MTSHAFVIVRGGFQSSRAIFLALTSSPLAKYVDYPTTAYTNKKGQIDKCSAFLATKNVKHAKSFLYLSMHPQTKKIPT